MLALGIGAGTAIFSVVDAIVLRYLERLIAERRFNMALLALFGGLGLVIAAVSGTNSPAAEGRFSF